MRRKYFRLLAAIGSVVVILFLVAIFNPMLHNLATGPKDEDVGQSHPVFQAEELAAVFSGVYSQIQAPGGRSSRSDREAEKAGLRPISGQRLILEYNPQFRFGKIEFNGEDAWFLYPTPISPVVSHDFIIRRPGEEFPLSTNFQVVGMPLKIDEKTAGYIRNIENKRHTFEVVIPDNDDTGFEDPVGTAYLRLYSRQWAGSSVDLFSKYLYGTVFKGKVLRCVCHLRFRSDPAGMGIYVIGVGDFGTHGIGTHMPKDAENDLYLIPAVIKKIDGVEITALQ